MLSLPSSHYLIPPPDYFWKWDPPDHAAVWSDGATLAFARELIPLLKELAHDTGLPPLGAVLLVISVAKQPEQLAARWEVLDRYARTLGVNNCAPFTVQRLMDRAREGLDLLARLPAELRQSQSARLLLLHTLFVRTEHRLQVAKSVEIVDEFRAALASELDGEHDLRGMTRLLRDLKAVVTALGEWNAESLESALRTGVRKSDLDAAQLELDLTWREAGDFWRDLEQSQDDEMRAVASLAKQLLAVIQIPRPLHRADDQPVGGVSDIANKGNPARLLLSELANDDETLAIRLAYDEALYLRRETPPATPLPQRHVLLDNGILLWGRARIFATAVALALVKPRTPGEVVALHGHHLAEFRDLSLGSTRDLRAWWSRLEVAADCAPALLGILGELVGVEDDEAAQPEIVLITHADAEMALAPYLREFGWRAGMRFFILTVTGQGQCVLWQCTEPGKREVWRIRLETPAALELA